VVTVSERLVQRLAGARPATGPNSHARPKTARRGFLAGAALVGAAVAADPIGYLTKPVGAAASLCGTDAECSAGYSAMCCTINSGANTCPPGTFVGGWWKADRSSFCGGAARYYIDCNDNAKNYKCRCNTTSCDHRLVACNIFRYGQCNTHIAGVTSVVCRVVSCTPPWKLYPGACSTTSATDNNTAGHTAPCLTAPPLYPRAPSLLKAGQQLSGGQAITSPNRRTTAVMQSDGNFVLYGAGRVLWNSQTNGRAPGGRIIVQGDGNLVIYRRDGVAVWSTRTEHTGGNGFLAMQDDENLVLYVGGRVRWASNT
jgi:hypothetical protein